MLGYRYWALELRINKYNDRNIVDTRTTFIAETCNCLPWLRTYAAYLVYFDTSVVRECYSTILTCR